MTSPIERPAAVSRKAFPHDQVKNIRRNRAERHSDTDLPHSPSYQEAEQTV